MKLDQQYIERTVANQRDSGAGVSLYCYIGHQEMLEGNDFGDLLKSKGVTYGERIISTVGTGKEKAYELHYRREEQGER